MKPKKTLRSFSNALLSGQLGPVISQFNLGEEAVKAAERGGILPLKYFFFSIKFFFSDVLAFAKALQKDEEKMDE